MHILVIPSWYPQEPSDVLGSFFREQALSLISNKICTAEDKIGVIYPAFISIRKALSKESKPKQGLVSELDDGIHTMRYFEYGLFSKFSKLQGLRWRQIGHRLYRAYVREHGKPDLIHAHSMLYGGVLANEIWQRHGVPFVLTEHASGYALNKYNKKQLKLASAAMKNAQKCLAVSKQLSIVLNEVLEKPNTDWEILPNSINANFENTELKSKTSPADSFIFLSVSLLTANKSIDTLIRAFAKVYTKYPSFVLKIGGDGPQRPFLENLTKQLNLTDRIQFLGKLTRQQVAEQMLGAHVFALPSEYETFGVVAVEAMACGLPVIATRCGGPESIVNDDNGFLVPVEDEKALGETMALAYEKYSQFDSQLIRRQCLANYSARVTSERLIKIYQQVISITK